MTKAPRTDCSEVKYQGKVKGKKTFRPVDIQSKLSLLHICMNVTEKKSKVKLSSVKQNELEDI